MLLPELKSIGEQVTAIKAFLGLNCNLQTSDGEFADMRNVSNDNFPCLTPRRKRGIVNQMTKPQGMLGGRYLAYVDDNKLYYDENLVCQLDKQEYQDKDRQMVMMGAYLIVFPDGVIYNTSDETVSHIENETTGEAVEMTLCKMDGTEYNSNNTVVSATEPSDKTKYWLDTSQNPVIIRMYSSSNEMWNTVPTVYVKFSGTGIGTGFKEGDAVTFSGVDKGDWLYNDYDFNQSNLIYAAGDDYLVIIGLINLSHTNSKTITFKREMPRMDFVCEQSNRIWGCSSEKHEIYACKQGDPKNWNYFGGLVSDSYAVTIGTQNVFTGAVSYGGYLYFFKEDGYHKLYGDRPSNYELVWKPCRGIQQGSEKSLAMINDYLIYKSREGVVIFSGDTRVVSTALGPEPYYDAVGGVYRDKYYVTMRNRDYEYKMYVYDISKNTWCIEDEMYARYMCYANGGMYFVNDENTLLVVNYEDLLRKIFPEDTSLKETYQYPNELFYPGDLPGGETEGTIEWSFETGDFGMDDIYQKYIKRLIIRLKLETDARVRIEIQYDSSGEWRNVIERYATRKRSLEIPVPVARCDHFRLRFSGFGEFILFNIAKVTEEGSGKG